MNYLRQSVFGLIVVGILCSIGMIVLIRGHVDTISGGRVAVADYAPFTAEGVLTVIQNVSVLSPAGDAFLEDRTVVIGDGTILSIDTAGTPPEGARLIDGRGRFLIPGLIDGHIDLRRQPNDLLLYLANGVTRVRDLSGRPEDLEMADELEGGRVGPSLTVASPQLVSAGLIEGAWMSISRPTVNVRNPDRAARVVEALAEDGYETISIDREMDPETFRAINAAAERIGIATVGRLPDQFDLSDLDRIALSELARIEDLVDALLDEFAARKERSEHDAFLDHVEGRAPAIADALGASGTAVVTTLWFADTLERQAGSLLEALQGLPLEYANPAMVEGSPYAGVGWLPGMNRFELPRDLDDERRRNTIAIWQTRNQAQTILLRALLDREIPIVAGSHATAELMIPGFSLHDELRILHARGLTTSQALASATRIPASLMGLNSGVIEAERAADLVLLRDDPLADITNTRTIEMVIHAGSVHDRTSLDAMLEAVEQAHAKSRKFELSRYQ